MENKAKVFGDLFVSISGVLIFISIAHFLDLNGFSSFAPLLIALGVIMLFLPKPFLKVLQPIGIYSKQIVLTISHILIFIGSKVYFAKWIEEYWVIYLIVGIFLLNQGDNLAKKIFTEG